MQPTKAKEKLKLIKSKVMEKGKIESSGKNLDIKTEKKLKLITMFCINS